MHAIYSIFGIRENEMFDSRSPFYGKLECRKSLVSTETDEVRSRALPGGLSITVSKPVLRVRPPDGAGESSESTVAADVKSSVPVRPCMYLKIASYQHHIQ